jgi:glycine cleavage system H lipoate-binding protein
MIMEEFIIDDPFATKAIEYLLVIGFLMAFIWYWRILNRRAPSAVSQGVARAAGMPAGSWFRLPANLYYHLGHGWARPEKEDVVRVGIDDFAQKLLGATRAVALPEVGARVGQGERGWQLDVGAKSIDVLSPVEGEVIERNEAALRSPELINNDPYGDGWLIKIRSPRMKANLRSLLHGRLARAWMEMTENALRHKMSEQLGPVLQDGGTPISGIARGLSPEHWDEIARDFLLTR